MEKRITKIKLKDDLTEIRFNENHGKIEEETVFRCVEMRSPGFEAAFSALEIDVREILDLASGTWPGLINVTGVTFSMSDETGVEGAAITGQVALETSNAPFCFNTPHLPFEQYSPTGNSPTFSEAGIKRLETARKEAQEYLDGKRAHLELPA